MGWDEEEERVLFPVSAEVKKMLEGTVRVKDLTKGR